MSIWQKPKPKAKRNKEKQCPTSITGRINTHTDCHCNCSRCRISEIESATAEGTEAHSEPPTVDVVGFLFLSFSFSRRSRKQKVCLGETACLLCFLSSLYFPRAPLLYNRLCSLTLRVRRTVAVVAVQQVPRSQCHTRLHRGHTHTLTHSCTDTLAAATAATTQTPT